MAKFPNVSVIDVTQTLSAFSKTIRRLSTIIRFFTGFSLVAGICILLSSVVATRAVRIREAVYFKILGATRGFVRNVFALESVIISALSALLALLLSHAGSWIVATYVLEMAYRPLYWYQCVATRHYCGGSSLLVGSLASRAILHHKPALFLREHRED